VALWLLQKDRSDDWELVLGTPLRDKLGAQGAYLELIKALSTDKPVALSDFPIRLESNRRPFIRALRKTFAKTASVEGMRLGLQSIGDTWIDDGYVYESSNCLSTLGPSARHNLVEELAWPQCLQAKCLILNVQ